MTVKEAAAALGKHRVTIRRMMAAGTLPTVREGGRVFIPTNAVQEAARHVCPHCGNTFTPARYATRGRYCSDACRWAATYQRRKKEHPATRGPGRPKKDVGLHRPPAPVVPDRLSAALERVGYPPIT